MSLALARKEAHEHLAVAVLALVSSALLMLLFLGFQPDGRGRFVPLTSFVWLATTANAMLAANRLFVREYGGQTQLFLEVLPISRARVFATKWAIGCAWTAGLTAAAWLATLEWQRRDEVIGWSDALPVLGATLSFALCAWAFAALSGTLGRYRYVSWIAAAGLVVVAVQAGGLAFDEIPVLRLLGPPAQMARIADAWPMALEALGVAALCSVAAACLALLGSGGIASALSRRMTARERVFVLVSAVGASLLYSTLDDDREKPPFELREGEIVEGRHVKVGVMPTDDFDGQRAQALAADIARDADGLIDALALGTRPTIFILPQRGLDRHVIERGMIGDRGGIVLRASHAIQLDRLRSYVLHSVLADHTRERALREDRHVLLDGLTLWWVLRGDAQGQERWWLRAAGSRIAITPESIQRWEETSEQLGPEIETSLAFAVVDALAAQLGEPRMLELLASLFTEPHDDARVLFETSPRARLAQLGLSWEGLARRAEEARQKVAVARARELAARPRVVPRVEVEQDAQGTRVVASLEGAPVYRVLYGPLGAWSRGSEGSARLDARAPRVVLPITPRRGSRLLAAIELDDPVLDCPVRVLAERLEVP